MADRHVGYTVIAAVRPGELSAMCPKAGINMFTSKRLMEVDGFYMAGVSLPSQTGTIAAVGGFAKFTPICFQS
jgi:hypothetical protein